MSKQSKTQSPKSPIEVAILVGSDSDLPVIARAAATLEEFGVPHEVQVLSAHRTPHLLEEYVASFPERGVKVVIAAAGSAAHLAGKLASMTTLPVIGVPLDAGGLGGLDALLSTVQMPGGIPVLTVAIGAAGATNAALGAIEILALSQPELREKLAAHRKKMADTVARKNAELQELGVAEYVRKKAAHG
ncbi:MAG: 5-(carboxyamino)imidazole ribonucleotide mutase [Candidatus Sumerlaeia bacterium]|nr:5-(carboxyamino)imidazole ribonucleotide mutase [Candidatus Sumerlaeia bacterium]